MIIVRPERRPDVDAIRTLHSVAFGGDAEATLVERLRAGDEMAVSLVADSAGRIVGNVVFSPLSVESRRPAIRALALAPLAVLPRYQRRGIGSRLVTDGIVACEGSGADAIFVLGDVTFYSRFGFSAAAAAHVVSPYSGPHWMALALTPDCLEDIRAVEYPPPFSALG